MALYRHFLQKVFPYSATLEEESYDYDRPDQLQRPRTPDLEKTAEKQPKKVPRGPRVKCRRNSRKTAGKTPEACKTAVFRLFGCPSGCFSAVFPALYSGATRHLFRLFFGCFQGPAFGASVAGRADREAMICDTAKGGRQKEFFDPIFRFRDSFGHFLVTFSDASVTFFVTVLPHSISRTPFAAG